MDTSTTPHGALPLEQSVALAVGGRRLETQFRQDVHDHAMKLYGAATTPIDSDCGVNVTPFSIRLFSN